MFYIAKGPDPGNSVSLLRVNVSNKTLASLFYFCNGKFKGSMQTLLFVWCTSHIYYIYIHCMCSRFSKVVLAIAKS